MRSLRHPYIVPCLDGWVGRDHAVNIVFAYCQGGDLGKHLEGQKKVVGLQGSQQDGQYGSLQPSALLKSGPN
jgi:hypothetical protein